jgi:hypothetical protein
MCGAGPQACDVAKEGVLMTVLMIMGVDDGMWVYMMAPPEHTRQVAEKRTVAPNSTVC